MTPVEKKLSGEEIDSLWNRIRKSTKERGKKGRRLWYSIAAACILFLILSILLINSEKSKNYKVVDYSQLLPVHTVAQDVEITLADQTKLKIQEQEKESVLKYGTGGKLAINSDKFIQQKAVKGASEPEIFNSIMVPKGRRANIIFADGTILWLNSGSSAVYPVEFSGQKREIYLKGEGYLEVAHDESRPFIVKTDLMYIKVLGTCFNISAYPEDATTRVILVEGKILTRLMNKSEVMIQPNQMISLNNETQSADVTSVNVEDYVSWKKGWLLCNSEELGSLVQKLERYYDQKIIFSDEIAKFYRLSGKLDLKENLNEVLQIIATTAPVKIYVENDAICIAND